MNFAKFFRTPFFMERLWWLLLHIFIFLRVDLFVWRRQQDYLIIFEYARPGKIKVFIVNDSIFPCSSRNITRSTDVNLISTLRKSSTFFAYNSSNCLKYANKMSSKINQTSTYILMSGSVFSRWLRKQNCDVFGYEVQYSFKRKNWTTKFNTLNSFSDPYTRML